MKSRHCKANKGSFFPASIEQYPCIWRKVEREKEIFTHYISSYSLGLLKINNAPLKSTLIGKLELKFLKRFYQSHTILLPHIKLAG